MWNLARRKQINYVIFVMYSFLSIQTIQTKPIQTDLWTNRWEPNKTDSLQRTDSNERFHHESDVAIIRQSVCKQRERGGGGRRRLIYRHNHQRITDWPATARHGCAIVASCHCHIMRSSSYVTMKVFWDAVSPLQGQRYTAEASGSGVNVSSWRSVSLSFPFSLIVTDIWWFALDQWCSVYIEGGFVITG